MAHILVTTCHRGISKSVWLSKQGPNQTFILAEKVQQNNRLEKGFKQLVSTPVT